MLLKDLVSRGASLEYIKVVAVVIAPPAADLLSKNFPSKPSREKILINCACSELGKILILQFVHDLLRCVIHRDGNARVSP